MVRGVRGELRISASIILVARASLVLAHLHESEWAQAISEWKPLEPNRKWLLTMLPLDQCRINRIDCPGRPGRGRKCRM